MLDYDLFLNACAQLRAAGHSFVIATIVDKKHSVPQEIGSKMIVTQGGIAYGTVGGGALEKRSVEYAAAYLRDGRFQNRAVTINLNKDLHMSCGGTATIFFEKISRRPAWNITIFGAGHVSQALCRVLVGLECRIVCVDTRQEWLDRLPEHAGLEKVLVGEYGAYVREVEEDAYVVVMTPGHRSDFAVLKELLKRPRFAYIGVIGSRSKRAQLDRDLRTERLEGEFFCPIGEKVGTNAPHEIAISIAAQLLRQRDLKGMAACDAA